VGDISLAEVHEWLLSLAAQNEQFRFAVPAALCKVLAERWFWTCYYNPDSRADSYHEFGRWELGRGYAPVAKLKPKFWLKNKVLRRFKG